MSPHVLAAGWARSGDKRIDLANMNGHGGDRVGELIQRDSASATRIPPVTSRASLHVMTALTLAMFCIGGLCGWTNEVACALRRDGMVATCRRPAERCRAEGSGAGEVPELWPLDMPGQGLWKGTDVSM